MKKIARISACFIALAVAAAAWLAYTAPKPDLTWTDPANHIFVQFFTEDGYNPTYVIAVDNHMHLRRINSSDIPAAWVRHFKTTKFRNAVAKRR